MTFVCSLVTGGIITLGPNTPAPVAGAGRLWEEPGRWLHRGAQSWTLHPMSYKRGIKKKNYLSQAESRSNNLQSSLCTRKNNTADASILWVRLYKHFDSSLSLGVAQCHSSSEEYRSFLKYIMHNLVFHSRKLTKGILFAHTRNVSQNYSNL